MPYSQAPTNDTYSSHRIPLVVDTTYRADIATYTKFTGMTNILPFQEKDGNETQLVGESRYGISSVTVATGANCRGMYVWEKTVGTVYYFVVIDAVTGSKVYTSTTGLSGSWTAVTTLTNRGTTPVRFTEFIDSSTNTKSLIMVDGIEGYIFTSNAAGTKITDVDFPTPHVPFPIFLDGYLFLAKANTGDIYNSDLNNPSSWTAGNFISSEMYPDDVQALVRIDNYILAVGQSGSEYFYDAGNSPGTPLARVEGASLPFGTNVPNMMAWTRNTVVLLANAGDGEAQFRYIEGLKYKEMPGQFIPQLLTASAARVGASTTNWRGFFFRQKGELFFGFTTAGVPASSPLSMDMPSFVYSFTNNIWVEFTHDFGVSYSFPVCFTAPAISSKNVTFVSGVRGGGGGTVFFGTLAASTSGSLLQDVIDSTGYPVYQETKLNSVTFGTMNLKTLSRLAIVYDGRRVITSGGTTSEQQDFELFWSDDGQSLTVNDGVVSLPASGGGYNQFPFWVQLGSFRSRQFAVRCAMTTTKSIAYRWKYLEADINKHQQ